MTTRYCYLVALAVFAACSSTPNRNSTLDEARARFNAAQSNAQVATLAPAELRRAGDSLRMAETAWTKHDKPVVVDHLAYLTNQRVTIAQETASSRASQAVTAGASAERDKLRLAMRTNEANVAEQRLVVVQQSNVRKTAELAEADAAAERDRARLVVRTDEANAAQEQLALSQASNARKSIALAEADANAVRDQARTERSDARADDLQAQLKELNAKKTERGMVVTLGDVLFDTGQSRLLPGSANKMAKLANFFKRNPQRTASIEGHTDSVGTDSPNLSLSQRRADVVRTALVNLGVAPDRLSTQALGAQNPTADNGTAAGRQMNRRVEIVFDKQLEGIASR